MKDAVPNWNRVPWRRQRSASLSYGYDRPIDAVRVEGWGDAIAVAVAGQREHQPDRRRVHVIAAGVVLRPAPARTERDHLERHEALLRHVVRRLAEQTHVETVLARHVIGG